MSWDRASKHHKRGNLTDIAVGAVPFLLLSSLLYRSCIQWEGVFVPVVPEKLMDVLGSPVPALVGVQAPFDPLRQNALDGVVVLDLDATKSSVRVVYPSPIHGVL